jgi:hypothetical protein
LTEGDGGEKGKGSALWSVRGKNAGEEEGRLPDSRVLNLGRREGKGREGKGTVATRAAGRTEV